MSNEDSTSRGRAPTTERESAPHPVAASRALTQSTASSRGLSNSISNFTTRPLHQAPSTLSPPTPTTPSSKLRTTKRRQQVQQELQGQAPLLVALPTASTAATTGEGTHQTTATYHAGHVWLDLACQSWAPRHGTPYRRHSRQALQQVGARTEPRGRNCRSSLGQPPYRH